MGVTYVDDRDGIVKMLELELRLARAGKTQVLAVASVNTDGTTGFGFAGFDVRHGKPPSWVHLLGALDVAKARLMHTFLGVEDSANQLPREVDDDPNGDDSTH